LRLLKGRVVKWCAFFVSVFVLNCGYDKTCGFRLNYGMCVNVEPGISKTGFEECQYPSQAFIEQSVATWEGGCTKTNKRRHPLVLN
jgi:hypothetical protein